MRFDISLNLLHSSLNHEYQCRLLMMTGFTSEVLEVGSLSAYIRSEIALILSQREYKFEPWIASWLGKLNQAVPCPWDEFLNWIINYLHLRPTIEFFINLLGLKRRKLFLMRSLFLPDHFRQLLIRDWMLFAAEDNLRGALCGGTAKGRTYLSSFALILHHLLVYFVLFLD